MPVLLKAAIYAACAGAVMVSANDARAASFIFNSNTARRIIAALR